MNEIRIQKWDGTFTFGYRVILVGPGSPLNSAYVDQAYHDYLYREFAAGNFLVVNEMDRFAGLVQDDSGQPLTLLYLDNQGHNQALIIKQIIYEVLGHEPDV